MSGLAKATGRTAMNPSLKFSAISLGLLTMLVSVAFAGSAPATERTEAKQPAIPAEHFHRDALAHPPAEVSPQQLATWLSEQSTLLIDLRSASEYQAGHLQGAINLPLTDMTEAELKRRGISKQARIVVYCDFQLLPTRRIALTTLGHPTLQQLGFDNVFTLEPLWQSAHCKAGPDQPCAGVLPFVRP